MLISFSAYGETSKKISGKKKIIYKYREYEEFDLDDLNVGGDRSSPGDLSIMPRLQGRFKNKLPLRKHFKPEMMNAVERTK